MESEKIKSINFSAKIDLNLEKKFTITLWFLNMAARFKSTCFVIILLESLAKNPATHLQYFFISKSPLNSLKGKSE
jgi:hypothetical protein